MTSGGSILQSQHIQHVVKPRRLAARPERGLERTACEDHAVGCLVRELDPLIGPRKDHAVFARDIAAAQAGKADAAVSARAGVTVAPAFGMTFEIDLAALC